MNMFRKQLAWSALAVMAGLMLSADAEAGLWNKMKSLSFWTRQWPETLIVTGNFAKPRLLAEQAQRKTDLPIIVISPETGGDEIYYLPAKPETLKIAPDKYMEFIEVIVRPKRIVVLGGDEFVAPKYVERFRGTYPTIVVSGDDWIRNAEQFGQIIGYKRLARHYRKSLTKLLEAEAHQPMMNLELEDFIIPE